MPSIFTRIVRGEIPCYKIAETADFLAFLDINPLKKGHLLVIPKEEIDHLFDLPSDLYLGLQAFAQEIGRALKIAVPCTRVGMAVIGLEVPHAHIHLVPIDQMTDLDFSRPKLQLTPEEMEEIARTIRQQLLKV